MPLPLRQAPRTLHENVYSYVGTRPPARSASPEMRWTLIVQRIERDGSRLQEPRECRTVARGSVGDGMREERTLTKRWPGSLCVHALGTQLPSPAHLPYGVIPKGNVRPGTLANLAFSFSFPFCFQPPLQFPRRCFFILWQH